MKGVILCGGKGTRLLPATKCLNKHLIPILNEPMVLYPLRTLISMGVEDILLVSGGNHLGGFIEFLGDGSEYGVNLTYKVQKEAGGIAQAISLAENFANGENIAVILGDNIFGSTTKTFIEDRCDKLHEAAILIKEIPNASRFGVLMGKGEKDYKIIEKPQGVTAGKAVTGLYFYSPSVFEVVKTLKPSARGELEVTNINNYYLQNDLCKILTLHDCFWSDAGTPESLAEVTKWAIENRQN